MTDVVDMRPDTAHANGNGNGKAHTNGKAHGNGLRPVDEVRANPKPRTPPHNLDAERSLLGAMLLSPAAIGAAVEICTVDSFYKPAHGHIFDAIVSLYTAGEPSDPVTVSERLARTGLVEGGLAALVDLQTDTPATSHAPRYAADIHEAALLRRLIAVGGEIAELGYARPDAEAALDQAEQMLFDLTDRAATAGRAEVLGNTLDPWLAELERRYNGECAQAYPTGLIDLDERLGGGLRPGQMVTVGGRPGSGKSIFGVQVGYHLAASQQKPSLIVSAEMPTEELVERLVASEARVGNQALRTGRLSQADWQKISESIPALSSCPLYIYDAPGATLASIRAEVRRVAAATGAHPTVVVDYVQLLTTAGKAENRQVEVDTLARGLKVLARDLKVPVIALCQLNRNLENRSDKRPVLGDLRESGGIENHSDIVIGVYRDEMYNPGSKDAGTAELIILKQRGGPIGTVRVAFLAHYGKFATMARM